MKEVSGELNLTVIVAIAVGILIAFFFYFMWPAINENYAREANCRKATCNCAGADKSDDHMCECTYIEVDNDGKEKEYGPFKCPYGG